jgi:hypothetical protein
MPSSPRRYGTHRRAEVTEGDDPRCEVCGAPVTSALMAAMCPHREKCEFWPEDKLSQDFLDGLGMRYTARGAPTGEKP